MGDYTLTFVIDNAVLAKQSKDNFCIAKKVAGKFTAVVQDAAIVPGRVGQRALYKTNVFAWTDRYRICAFNTSPIQSATDHIEIKFGQASVFEKSAFQMPTQAPIGDFPGGEMDASNSFIAKSVPDTLKAAVQTLAGGAWVSIYVDHEAHNGPTNKVFSPLNEYMVFWHSNTQTEFMIDDSVSDHPYIFSFRAGENTKSIRFGYATADQPTPNESPKFYEA